MQTNCWFLSTITALIIAAPLSAFAGAGATSIDGGDGGGDASLNIMPNERANASGAAGVACSVRHTGYNVSIGDLFFSLRTSKVSATINGPTASLFKIEFESVGGEVPAALITLRGDTNYIRFLDRKSNFVSRRNGLDGYGTKSLQGMASPVSFQIVTSTGKPGVIVVDCRMEPTLRRPAQERVASNGDVREVNFSETDD